MAEPVLRLHLWGPPASLILLTALVPELLSGSTPAVAMTPVALLLFVLAYGLPIMALREIAVRCGTGPVGIFVMGLGYGLVNEGLYARTIFRATGSPLPMFDGMEMVLGVNVGFAAVILCWHALTSVLLPITLVRVVWGGARQPWLGRRGLMGVAGASVVAATGFFVVLGASLVDQGKPPEVPDWAALAGLWPVILGLVAVGSWLRARGEGHGAAGPFWPFLVGLAGIVPFFLVLLPAEAGAPLALSLVALVVCGLAYGWIVARVTGGRAALIGWMGLGWYLQSAFFSAFHIFPISPVSVVVNMVVLAVLFAMARRMSR